jgi:selenocysteine lyase/cysteine desulfurase
VFDKNVKLFPSKKQSCFLSHCAVSPLYGEAASTIIGFQGRMASEGLVSLSDFVDVLPRFRKGFATLLKTAADNISYVHSTAEAMCQIANGYPFKPGDQIISYVHEYPSNHYPWLMQQQRGVELRLLPDVARSSDSEGPNLPVRWSMSDLERLCTSRTRLVAISHVQFTSGHAADLLELGAFCRKRNIDLVVDCAQSLGCLPVYPEEFNIAALASSGWKWLLGPKGASVMYTAPDFREKITPTMAGPGMMRQLFDYLDHSWNPFADGRLFEYSTLPWDHVAALAVITEEIFSRYRIEEIREEVFRLQDLFLDGLDPDLYRPLHFDRAHRSGILGLIPLGDPASLAAELINQGVVVTERGGYLRVAPHFYIEDEQVREAASQFNKAAL